MSRARLVAMENALFSDSSLDWERRCAAIAEAGFAGVYAVPYPLADDDFARLRRLDEAPRRHGLRVAAVYANLDLSLPAEHAWNKRVLRLVEECEGAPRVEVSFKASDAATTPVDLDGAVLRWLERLLAIAERRALSIAIYPHSFYPVEAVAHAARLAHAVGGGRIGYLFPTSHVYAVNPSEEVARQLAGCAGEIVSFNVCGCRRSAPGPRAKCAHFALGEGELALGPLFAALKAGGYAGDVIVQGHGWTGDLKAALERSVRVATGCLG